MFNSSIIWRLLCLTYQGPRPVYPPGPDKLVAGSTSCALHFHIEIILTSFICLWHRFLMGNRGITAENMEKSQHTDFNEDKTNESASVACSHVQLWKLDTHEEWRNTSWGLWDERTEKDSACFMDSKENKWVSSQQSWSKEGTARHCQRKEASILWSHHEEKGNCLEKEIMQGTMPGVRRRGRPRTAWIDNIKSWTGLSVEESIQNDRG